MAKGSGTNAAGYGRVVAKENREREEKIREKEEDHGWRFLKHIGGQEDATRPFPIQQLTSFLSLSNRAVAVRRTAAISEGQASACG